MSDLVAFIRSRLDEDEAAALATEHVHGGPVTLSWSVAGRRHLQFDNGCSEDYMAVRCGNLAFGWDRILIARDEVRGGPLAEHIARWDPARVLAEVSAKRTILDLHEQTECVNCEDACRIPGTSCRTCHHDEENGVWRYDGTCRTLLALTQPFSEHPDWNQDWSL